MTSFNDFLGAVLIFGFFTIFITALSALFGALLVRLVTFCVAKKFEPSFERAYTVSFLIGMNISITMGLIYFIDHQVEIYFIDKGWIVCATIIMALFISTVIFRSMIKHPEIGVIGFGKAFFISFFVSFALIITEVLVATALFSPDC